MVSSAARLAWVAGCSVGIEAIRAELSRRNWAVRTLSECSHTEPDALVYLGPRPPSPCAAVAISAFATSAVTRFVAAAQQTVNHMARRGGGAIVVVTDIAGVPGRAGHAAQAAVSGALIGACKCLAKEIGRQGISVNVVAHGFMPQIGADGHLTAAEQKIFGAMNLGKAGNTEHLVENLVHLMGNRHLMTGQVLHVDDGLVM